MKIWINWFHNDFWWTSRDSWTSKITQKSILPGVKLRVRIWTHWLPTNQQPMRNYRQLRHELRAWFNLFWMLKMFSLFLQLTSVRIVEDIGLKSGCDRQVVDPFCFYLLTNSSSGTVFYKRWSLGVNSTPSSDCWCELSFFHLWRKKY